MGTLTARTQVRQEALLRPSADLREEFLAMAQEFLVEGDYRFEGVLHPESGGFDAHLARLKELERGLHLGPGQVQTFTYWLVGEGKRIVGTVRLRLEETPFGHIGYDVRPSERGKGYGNMLLELVLPYARQAGMACVTLRCRIDNVPSRRVIERNGGILQSIDDTPDGTAVCMYTIQL